MTDMMFQREKIWAKTSAQTNYLNISLNFGNPKPKYRTARGTRKH